MKTAGSVTIARQAPESATGGDTEVVKRKAAIHELLDAQGNVVETEEDANGIRYTLIALPNQPFTYQYGQDAITDKFLAIFGAKTLCTNESSAVRNNPKGEGSAQEQMDAVIERYALLKTNKWVDRSREGVGAKVDKDSLAEAICQVMVAEGKWTDADVQGGKKADVRSKLEDDPAYLRKARQVPAVATAYAALVGRASATTDDLAF